MRNENVSDFRYALVESDDMEIERQNAIIRNLELPVACLVHSGKRSLHAIVHIDAPDYDEYRKRVDYLYAVCKKNGMKIDSQNRNPSRLSRMPGIMRDGRKQYLVDTNIGKTSWAEWREWIESVNDELPDPEPLEEVWNNLPDLAPPLIENVLRQGHKMLLSGPSKAGKSFALIQLAIAIAEGKTWLGWRCARGRVLYVNLELDRASCLHRFKDVYDAKGWEAKNLGNLDVWNLRGNSVPMDKLAPKLIRRAAKKGYIAVILDPIYKVITGDENSADQMAHFCNQFDRVCHELGAAVIYCHHHSKGYQGGKKSMDRSSGSGVFARDPDALLDLIELDTKGESSAWRVAGTLREFPIFEPINIFFRYPVHVLDERGELDEAKESGAMQQFSGPKKSPEERRDDRIETLDRAFDACAMDGEVNLKELSEYMATSEKTARRRILEAPDYWLSEGVVSRKR